MSSHLNYDQVKAFVRAYSTKTPPYDPNGVLHLILAGVENFRAHSIDQDFLDFAHVISDEQAALLRRLLDSRPESIAQYEKDV